MSELKLRPPKKAEFFRKLLKTSATKALMSLTPRIRKYQPLQALAQRERMRSVGVVFLGWIVLRQGRMTVAENQMPEQKSMLVVRAPLSEDGWASIYFSSNDGRQMSEREWWHLKQLIELASKAFVKPEPKSQSAAAGG